MLLGGSNDPYGETLHSLLSLVRGKYLNIAPWEQEDTFFLDGRGWCCYRWIFVDFVLEHNGKKGRWTELRMEMWLVDISGAICLEQSTPSLIELSIRMFSWISNWKACYYGNHQN